jgi:hypothetical protein
LDKNKEKMHVEKEVDMIGSWFNNLESQYKYIKQELKEEGLNPVIAFLYHTKQYKNESNFIIQER